jgi:hypothetical protein
VDTDNARLGMATTRELLEEIKARAEVEASVGYYVEEPQSMAMGAQALLDSLPGSMLDYRTASYGGNDD